MAKGKVVPGVDV